MKHFTLVLASAFYVMLFTKSCKEKTTNELPPQNVQVVEVIQQDIPVIEEFVGQTYGLFDISIQARVDGFIEGMHFEEGSRVIKGQLLYTIDPQPFEAKLAGTMGQLAEANTMLVKAESDLARIEPLAKINAVSQSDLDAALAHRDAATASVSAAEAAVTSARIELGYTRIYSPIKGIIGKTEAYPGDYVGRGIANVILNEVSRVDTILVNFHISEEKYMEIARPYLEGNKTIKVQHREDQSELTMKLSDGTMFPEKGQFKFINRQVNATTGTLMLQASFPNPSGILRPGQFAKVLVVIDIIKGGLLIPQRCVQELQGNYNVFVVNDQNELEFRKIEVGFAYQAGFLTVTSGLSPGEKVVYEGLQKVKSGAKVNPELMDISIPETEN
ncbi:MAG: efflux RND transporter periplasmic adaptor subunit [Bacteroidales bacterium]